MRERGSMINREGRTCRRKGGKKESKREEERRRKGGREIATMNGPYDVRKRY